MVILYWVILGYIQGSKGLFWWEARFSGCRKVVFKEIGVLRGANFCEKGSTLKGCVLVICVLRIYWKATQNQPLNSLEEKWKENQ